jgi:succinate-acetate transporter protein
MSQPGINPVSHSRSDAQPYPPGPDAAQEAHREPDQRWTKAGPVSTHFSQEDVDRLGESQELTAAEPAPMGLFGFAVGTIAIGYVLSGFAPLTAEVGTAPVLLIFAGIAQFIAAMWAYRRRNTFAATAFACYGANNTVVAGFLLLSAGGAIPLTNGTKTTLSIELFSFAFISLVLGVAALRLNPVFVALLWALVPGFALSGLGLVGEPGTIGNVGGYFLILSALLAFYAAAALVVNSTYRRTVLPLFGRA